jgi:hypothetical protein
MSWIIKFLSLPILNSLVAAYKHKLDAGNTQDAKAVELAVAEIQGEIAARSAAKEIIIAEQGRWWTAAPRPIIAFAIAIFIWKVVVWDKVLGLGTTDPLDPKMWEAFTIVLTAYFGGRSLEKIAQVFRGRR